tara:strand:- start:1026 stop:3548 length:2523 start_codon:yes stop_codon:yes gene_type:complete
MAAFFNFGSKIAEGQLDKSLEKRAKAAAAQGTKDAQLDAAMGVTSVSKEISEKHSGPYGTSYASALGHITAARAETQFASDAIVNQVRPADYGKYRQDWFNENFGPGTGNPFHDNAFVNAWSKNTVDLNHKNMVAASKNAVIRAREVVNTSVNEQIAGSDHVPNATAFESQMLQIRAAYPNETQGQSASRLMSMYADKASETIGGTKSFYALLRAPLFQDTQYAAEVGAPRVSFADRFPKESKVLEQQTFDKLKKFTTYAGTQAVASLASRATAASAAITNISDMGSFYQAQVALNDLQAQRRMLEKTPGTGVAIAALDTKLSKALNDFNIVHNSVQSIEILTTFSPGTPRHEQALNSWGSLTTAQRETAAEIMTNGANLDVLDDAQQVHSQLSAVKDTGAPVPAAFGKLLSSEWMTGDQNKMSGVLSIFQQIDPDGSYAEEVFKKDQMNAALLQSARVNGVEQTISLMADDNYKVEVEKAFTSMTGAGSNKLGRTLTQGLVSKTSELVSEETDFKKALGQALDQKLTLFTSGLRPNAAVMREVERMIPSEIALLKIGKQGYSQENLVDAIVSRLKDRTAPHQNHVGLMPAPQDRVYVGDKPAGAPGNQMPADIVREGLAFNGIYFGGSVSVAWDGDPQNTFKNAQDSVADLENRISGTEGFIDTSGMFVTLGDGAKSGFGLVRQKKGAEVVLVAGQKFQATPRTLSYLNLVPGANQLANMLDGEVLDAQEFSITGIYEQDNINVRKHFGEEFQVVPIGNGSYYLTVLPHAVGVPDIGNRRPPSEYLTEARLAAQDMEIRKRLKIERMGKSPLELNVEDALKGAPSSSTVMNTLNSEGTP